MKRVDFEQGDHRAMIVELEVYGHVASRPGADTRIPEIHKKVMDAVQKALMDAGVMPTSIKVEVRDR